VLAVAVGAGSVSCWLSAVFCLALQATAQIEKISEDHPYIDGSVGR
jgi:hypothetical protein